MSDGKDVKRKRTGLIHDAPVSRLVRFTCTTLNIYIERENHS